MFVKLRATSNLPPPLSAPQVEGQIDCVAWSCPVITVQSSYRNISHSGKLLEFFLNETSSNKYRNDTSEVWGGRGEREREGGQWVFLITTPWVPIL